MNNYQSEIENEFEEIISEFNFVSYVERNQIILANQNCSIVISKGRGNVLDFQINASDFIIQKIKERNPIIKSFSYSVLSAGGYLDDTRSIQQIEDFSLDWQKLSRKTPGQLIKLNRVITETYLPPLLNGNIEYWEILEKNKDAKHKKVLEELRYKKKKKKILFWKRQ